MNAAQRDRTFQDGIGRECVLRAIHCSPKLNEIRSVFWTLQPAPLIFIDIVCFVKGSFVRFIGMPKLSIEKSLSKITGALEAYVETVEAH
jgi:hypothetical protein